MSPERKDKHFIKKPIYPGGSEAMRSFINKNLKYPKAALEKRIEGVVLVKYDIDYEGHVIEARVIHGIGAGCDEEAIRVVKKLKFKVPKNPRKLKVLFHKEAKIRFKLPASKPERPVEQSSFQYSYLPSESKPSSPQKKKSYNITLMW